MPTYEYECAEGHRFERFQKMSDPPVTECPECGAGAQRVLSGGAGFLFKGEGFYITDYRSKEYREKAASEKKKTEKGGDAGGTKDSGSKGSGSKDASSKNSGSKDSGSGSSSGDASS